MYSCWKQARPRTEKAEEDRETDSVSSSSSSSSSRSRWKLKYYFLYFPARDRGQRDRDRWKLEKNIFPQRPTRSLGLSVSRSLGLGLAGNWKLEILFQQENKIKFYFPDRETDSVFRSRSRWKLEAGNIIPAGK